MNEDIVQAAKAAAELEPAVEAFGEATGALEPIREMTSWLADIVRYRRLPHQARLLQRAAEKIKASGILAHAVPDKTLRAILEDGPLDDDESMQDRWANLLFKAATAEDGNPLAIAYPKILGELEPNEAQLLDRIFDREGPGSPEPITYGHDDTHDLVGEAELYNLERLGLLKWIWTTGTTWDQLTNGEVTLTGVQMTELGWQFVLACRGAASTSRA